MRSDSLVGAHVLPDVLDQVQLRALGRQRHERDVGWHGQLLGCVSPSLVEDEGCARARRDGGGDLDQMQVHRPDVALGQDQADHHAVKRADRAEYGGGRGALIQHRDRPSAAFGPASPQLRLLTDAGLIAEPDF